MLPSTRPRGLRDAIECPRTILAVLIPYTGPAGYWTIGYGHLCYPKHPSITVTEAEVYLAHDL